MITGTGGPHVSPPFVEVLTNRPLSGPVSSKPRLNAYTRFDGPKSTHGSVTRWNSPPARIETPCNGLFIHVRPPSKLVPSTRLRAPPVVQRSSCQAATTFPRFDWLTETVGSVCESNATCPLVVSSSAVSGPTTPWSVETRTSESGNGGAVAIAEPAAAPDSPETPAEKTAPWKVRPAGPRLAAIPAAEDWAEAARARTNTAVAAASRLMKSPHPIVGRKPGREENRTAEGLRPGTLARSRISARVK